MGKAVGRYNLHLGGNREGTRIPRMYRENINEDEILSEIDLLVGRWAKERNAGEGFGDFTVRAGVVKPVRSGARFLGVRAAPGQRGRTDNFKYQERQHG